MVYLNVDRVLEVLLNIKYPLHVTKRRVKFYIAMSWFMGLLVSVFMILSCKHTGENTREVLNTFSCIIVPCIDGCYIIFTIASYVFIFKRFHTTRTRPASTPHLQCVGILTTFRQSRFFVALLLISSFVLFAIVPDIVLVVKQTYTGHLRLAFTIITEVTLILDALIYIFLDTDIKQLLQRRREVVRMRKMTRTRTDKTNVHIVSFTKLVETEAFSLGYEEQFVTDVKL